MSQTVNETTAMAATEKAKLPLQELRLLGIVTRKGKGQALLRQPDGTTFWASVGSETPFGDVLAISEDALILDTGTSKRRLTL